MEDKEIVLVTGGNGFVGLHIVLQLLQEGHKVRTTLCSMVCELQQAVPGFTYYW
ncbi:NAD-dependent epimerase/dehydratase family protein [Dyadobacter alkalitolerans]|uniref:NAD-dependent epimerase/dehydratase family protein n=1 Tax=Dyadobacter alkalitolerans TaxID=492736 RepID=UPI0012FB8616|nr:NAD-dependent epimerase/dehydratase family protein [Dyadobacter alkalitolerans]